MYIFGKFHSINDITQGKIDYKKPNREDVKILLIDDEPFSSLERLKRNNFRITQVKDIEDVALVNEYEIILVDIEGIAQSLSEKYQGAFLIKEIRNKYPHKTIVAYSAKTFDASYNEYFSYANYIFLKDISTEQWVENLDVAINHATDAVYQWKELRDYLLKKDVRLDIILKVENNFVRSFENKENKLLDNGIKNMVTEDIHAILVNFAASLLFRIFIGA